MELEKSKQKISCLDVLGIGAPLVDHIIHVSDEILASIPGQKGGMEPVDFLTFTKLLNDLPQSPKLIPGGSSANVLRGLSQLGHSCAFIGKIGTDSIGDFFIEDLNKFGIESLCIRTSTPTGQVLVLVTPDGERTFQSFLGAVTEISAENIDKADFENAKIVHLEGYSLIFPNLLQSAVKNAKAVGAIVSLDLASFELIGAHRAVFIDLIKSGVDICFGNEREIKALTGLFAREGCEMLKEFCPIAVATMGKNGCWVGNKKEIIFSPSFPVERPLDTTGAGDLFISGFLHGYLEGKSLGVCAQYGAAAGAAVVQVEGARLTDVQWELLKRTLESINLG